VSRSQFVVPYPHFILAIRFFCSESSGQFWDYPEPTASRKMGFLFDTVAYLNWTLIW